MSEEVPEQFAKLLTGPPAKLVEMCRLNPGYVAATIQRLEDERDWLAKHYDESVARAEQAEAQSRTDLGMAVEYRAEREQAYALIARMRPDERFVWDVRQLLDVDRRGLRDPVETLDAVRVLLASRDAERKAVTEPS